MFPGRVPWLVLVLLPTDPYPDIFVAGVCQISICNPSAPPRLSSRFVSFVPGVSRVVWISAHRKAQMQRSDSTKSAAPSAASTEGSYDPLPVTPVRHGGGDGVFGGAVDGSGGGGEDSGDTDRTVPSPARNLSYRSPTTAHVSHKESAMSYREDLMDWHCQPQRDDESDRNQLPEETDHSRDYDSDDVRDDSHARKGRIHRPPTPFALLSDQPEPSQRSPEHHKAVDGDKKGSSHESAEDGNGGRRQSRAPVDMTLELPLPPSSSLSDGNNLRLQPQTLATPSMPDGRRKLFSSRHVLFAAPTPPNTQTAPSLQNGTLSNSPGWTSAPPAITITPPKDSARRRDGRRTVTDGDAAGLFGGALNTDERWADRVKQQQQRSATIWPLTQPPTAGSLNEKKRHNEDEKRRADERRTLSLSELYAARRDGDIVKRKQTLCRATGKAYTAAHSHRSRETPLCIDMPIPILVNTIQPRSMKIDCR